MSEIKGIFDLVELIGQCLERSDWDSLAAIEAPALALPEETSVEDIQTALDAIEQMQARLQNEMGAVRGDLVAVPTMRKAVRSYLRS